MTLNTLSPDISAKQRLLRAARSAMLTKGYKATSVEEICEEAGLTKGSFFHYFKSKEDLALQLLGYFYEPMRRQLEALEARVNDDPLERVYAYLAGVQAFLGDPKVAKSCLLGNFAQELADTNPAIREACRHCFTDWAERLGRLIEEAKAERAPEAPFDSKSLAAFFVSGLEGSLVLAKAQQDSQVVEDNLLHFRNYLDSLFAAGLSRPVGSRKHNHHSPS